MKSYFQRFCLALTVCAMTSPLLMAQETAPTPSVDIAFPFDLVGAVTTMIGLIITVVVIGYGYSFGMTAAKSAIAFIRGALRKGNSAS